MRKTGKNTHINEQIKRRNGILHAPFDSIRLSVFIAFVFSAGIAYRYY
jgi:hypothetical protein